MRDALLHLSDTAAAAGVITDKLGGSLSDTVTYVVIINIMAALVIPLIIPMVHPVEGVSFLTRFASICAKVFPLLVFPLLLAWLVRYTMKKLHEKLVGIAGWAFYIWGFTLCLSIYLATKALLGSGISIWAAIMICVVSLLCTLIQFVLGRRIGRRTCVDESGPGVRPKEQRLPDLAGVHMDDSGHIGSGRPLQHLAEPCQLLGTLRTTAPL